MVDTNETIADIIAEMRGMGNYQRYSGDHARVLANRIEAAMKRERAKIEADALEVGGIVEAERKRECGDAAKLREALVQAELFVGNIVRHGHQTLVPGDKCTACDGAEELRDIICAALAKPVKNCDKGTADEQRRRFDAYCTNKGMCERCKKCINDTDNLDIANIDCVIEWENMPYEEEGGNDAD